MKEIILNPLNENELLDAFDINGTHIGAIGRKFGHTENAGYYHKAVHIWFVNDKKQILIQKRSKDKAQNPNKWDIPSAGHVEYKENLLTTCQRETFEELGIKLEKNKFIFKAELFKQKGWEFQELYLVYDNTPIEKMVLQTSEVSEVKWLTLEEFKNILFSNEFVSHSDEYKYFVFNFIEQALNDIKD